MEEIPTIVKNINMEIYIVYLHTGNWDSYRYTILKVFSNKESAESYAKSLKEKLDNIGWHVYGNLSKAKEYNSKESRINYYDNPVYFEDEVIDFPGAWITVSEPIKLED